MKKILSSFIVFLLITLLLLSCEKNIFHRDTSYYSIEIDNRTEQNIYALCRYEEYKKRHNCLLNDSVVYHIVNIAGGENIHFLEMRFDPEKFFLSTDTISIFILSKEEYEGKSWSQLVDSGQFLQVYHLSGDDIRRLGSCVPFPPTAEMCDMVMEPACQE